MTFNEFKQVFDKPGSVVLLEGKSDVADSDQSKLLELSTLLFNHTKHIIYRSGNASGADELFCSHIMELSPARLELILPYATHRKKASPSQYIKKIRFG